MKSERFTFSDLWAKVKVTAGVFRVTCYVMNKDGHSGNNRFRDYLVELKPFVNDLRKADERPALAKARIQHAWGGVYKQFVVHGPGQYWIKIAKNDSYNTILSAVMLDQIAGTPAKNDHRPLFCTGNRDYRAPINPVVSTFSQDERLMEPLQLRQVVDASREHLHWPLSERRLLTLGYRAACAADAPANLAANWRWELRLWTDDDRHLHDATIREAWESHLRLNPQLKNLVGSR